MDLRILTDVQGSRCTVRLEGSCDLATAPKLREALLPLVPPEVTDLVVDVSALDYLASTGLGVLLGTLRRMREGGGRLQIAGAHGQISRMLQATGLHRVLPLI